MPLPFISKKIKIGSNIVTQKVKQLKKPKQIVEASENRYNAYKHDLINVEQETLAQLASLEKLEVKIFKSFQRFSNAFEHIKNRPEFEQKSNDKFSIPEHSFTDFKRVEEFQSEMHKKFMTISMIPLVGSFFAFGSILKELKNNSSLEKALEVQQEVDQIITSIRKSHDFLRRLDVLAIKMEIHLNMIHKIYRKQVYLLETLVEHNKDYTSYSYEEKMLVDTNIKLVAILYKLTNQDLAQQEEQSEDIPILLDDQANDLMLESEQAVNALNLIN